MSDCQTPGCARRATGHSRFCNSHRSRFRRHGDPLQETITAHRLKPYVLLLRGWVSRQRQDNLWQLLESAWYATVDRTRATLAEYKAGRPSFRHEVQACEDLVSVAHAAPVRRIVETILAMAIMQEREPRTFRSDGAFWCQTARRFRGLSDVHCGSYWDNRADRVKRVYRDPKPRSGEALGWLLMQNLQPAAQRIVASWAAEAERGTRAGAALSAALTECGA